jgi:DNA topoisomerase-1
MELEHVHGGEAGLRRERQGDRFAYRDASDEPVSDPESLARIDALKIPPAWTDVWIAATANAHLQATGLDAKGRRQYLYHPAWRERRDAEKFTDMLDFAQRLPALRATVKGRLAGTGESRDRVLALAIRLLDVGFFRVGWDRYARDNGHVGLTTVRRDQVRLLERAVRFDFVAKAGKRRRLTVRDAQAVRALAPLERRRGGPAELLAYRVDGGWRRIQAADVNNGLRCWAKGAYSAKEFRTWAATTIAAVALAREDADGHGGPRAINRAVRQVSTALGNTPKVARGSYIDPRVISAFEDGSVIGLPDGLPAAVVPLRIEAGDDGVIIELPTDVDGDALRSDVERRVIDLLAGSALRSGRDGLPR